MELLSKDKGMHRSVSYFANELCYTPKHFSKVIKQACGRTPLDLINETTVEHIKYRLKRSEKSIKEIAEEFNFPNQSFFGKYVKAHLGTSPANYRSRKEEWQKEHRSEGITISTFQTEQSVNPYRWKKCQHEELYILSVLLFIIRAVSLHFMKNALHLELQISQITPDRYYKQTSCNKSSHSKVQTTIISQEMHQIDIYK